jgi:hypothetical protein|tara:strand:+ start:3523 stop:3741 length:219 start_codon:yes stop_codon:yes gene_type:complete
MKIGDLVKLKAVKDSRPGLIVEFVEKKCWRTDDLGNKIDWNKAEPEPHAVVLFRSDRLAIPMVDLEAIDEGR